MRTPAFATAPPNFEAAIDVERHLAALPLNATANGMVQVGVVEGAMAVCGTRVDDIATGILEIFWE